MVNFIINLATNVAVFSWDMGLTLLNLVTPNRPADNVVPEGYPGAHGLWPEYQAPKDTDSRCSCPALNAMANHGILPRDGRNISFKELTQTIRTTWNFSPSFCFFVPNFSANFLNKSYSKGTIDLEELDLHSEKAIEHDASLTREDVAFHPSQAKPHLPFVYELLESATGENPDGTKYLTIPDLARFSGKRRADSRATNPNFSLSFFHKMFGSSNSSTLLEFFGGQVKDLTPFLVEERIPEGWQPAIRSQWGLTMAEFNTTVLRLEFGIKEPKTTTATSSGATTETSPLMTNEARKTK